MAFTFGGISIEKLNRETLNEKFDAYHYSSNETFYFSKEIFHHDPKNEDDGDFEYRYGIRVVDWSDYGDVYQFSVELHFVPLSQHIADKFTELGYAAWNEPSDFLHSNDYMLAAIDEGYTIQFVREDFDYGEDCEQSVYDETKSIANEKAVIAADVFTCVDGFRGFYLDKYVNRIGTQGWDLLNDWVYEKGDYIKATLAKCK